MGLSQNLAIILALLGYCAATIRRARVLQEPGALRNSYDYIIVGGGTAGLTVGDRLSEDGKSTVLVIENGGIQNLDIVNWVRDRDDWNAPHELFYNLTTVPLKELNDLVYYPPAGSLVGGSSAINGMQSVRGTRDDYNRWGEFFNKSESGWSWDGLLPYFKKAIHFQKPSEEMIAQMPGLKYDTKYWGNSSHLYSGWPTFQWPGIKYQFEAFSNLSGVEMPEDSGSGKPGVYWYPSWMDAVHTINRSYAYTAHWQGIQRSNYDLITWTKVTQINLSDENSQATGVTYRPNVINPGNVTFSTIKANKEVILSAGTFHSPHLLQLSGIGPRNILDSAGIETKVELPGVGQSFHDHNCLEMNINYTNYHVYPNRRDNFTQPAFVKWANELWAANRTGPWSHGYWNTGAWLPFPIVAPDTYEAIATAVEAQNASEYLPDGAHSAVVAGYQARLHSHAKALRSHNHVYYSHYFSGDQPVYYFTYEHPLSFGTININTTHPDAEPVIDYRTYSNPIDFDIMLALARFHRQINEDSPVLAQFSPLEISPGRNVTSREDWIAYMRDNTIPTAEHPSGSCPMMPLELGGVVDEELKVYSVSNLRVVDASVIPLVPGANIASTVFAIAEKAADMIKGQR